MTTSLLELLIAAKNYETIRAHLLQNELSITILWYNMLSNNRYMGPYRTKQDHKGPYGTKRDQTRPYRTVRDYTEPYGNI